MVTIFIYKENTRILSCFKTSIQASQKNLRIPMSNKTDRIFYWPEEGTTGFYGLRDYPNEPKRWCECDGNHCAEFDSDDPYTKSCRLGYEQKVESCKSNKLELLTPNPMPVELQRKLSIDYQKYLTEEARLKPGDIFDLPSNYEFKEGYQYHSSKKHYSDAGWVDCTESQYNSFVELKFGMPRKVLRLVKTETKETCPTCGTDEGKFCSNSKHISQPEPEESQEKLWNEIWNHDRYEREKYARDNFTIQRKKQ